MEGFLFLVAVVSLGYLAARFRLVSEALIDGLPGLLLNVCYPILIFGVFQSTDYKGLVQTALPFLIAATAISFVLFFIALGSFPKSETPRRSVLRLILCAGNTSFVCVPLYGLFLNEAGMVYVFLYDALQNLFLWTIHRQLFLGSAVSDRKMLLKKTISPCLIACICGIALSWAKLPGVVVYFIENMKPVVSPLAFLLLGMLIHRYGLLAWCRSKTAIVFAIAKTLVLPLVLFAVLYFLLPFDSALLLALLFGAPPPIVSIIWSKEYGGDTQLAVNCLIPATIFYMLAISGILLVLGQFGFIS